MQNNDIYDMDKKMYFNDNSSVPSPCPSQSSISSTTSGYSSHSGASNATLTNFPYYDINQQADFSMNYIPTVPSQNMNCLQFPNFIQNSTVGVPANGYSSHLVILEQPTEKFRFRYKSEMHGTHGSLNGVRSEKSKKTFPEVELKNFNGNGIIRCSLYQTTMDRPSPHSHQLVVRKEDTDECDPHDVNVSPEKGYIARFENMGIIHTAKKNICDALFAKKRQKLKFETGCKELSFKQEKTLKEEAEREGKLMNLNQVRLCFEAFEIVNGGEWVRICEPVYSNPINNRKSALTGELKICRLSSVVGSAAGGEDLILLVEKVSKKNIQVRFYEMRDDEPEWEAFGDFSDADVHHQYAIVVRTPPYRNKEIDSTVNVFIELVRKSDDERSAPVTFRYKPRDIVLTRKRRRTASYASSSPLSSSELPESVARGIVFEQMNQPMQFQAPTISEEYKKDTLLQANFEMHVANDSGDLEKFSDQSFSFFSEFLHTDGVSSDKTSHKNQLPAPIKNILCNAQDVTKFKTYLDKFSADHENGDTIIHEIIRTGQNPDLYFNILEKLKLTEISSQTNHNGQTPLHYACIFNQHSLIPRLLAMKCNPNVQDNKGNTALHIVVNENCKDCLLLFDKSLNKHAHVKFNANLSNDDGFTPLHLAIRQNNLEFVRILLTKFNASAKAAISKDGNNALHLAVQHHNPDIVKCILENSRIQMNAKNCSGLTAIDLAKTLDEKIRKGILDLLIAKLPSLDDDSPMTIDSIKNEPEDDSSTEDEDDKSISSVEDRTEEACIMQALDNKEILEKLAEILGKNDKWKKLSVELKLDHLLCMWINAKAMLMHLKAIKVDGPKLFSALQIVEPEAVRILRKPITKT